MSKIRILNSSLVEQGTIEGVFSAGRTERLNSDNVLSFTVPLTAEINGLINESNVVEVDDDYFDIVYFQKGQSSDGSLIAVVECEHISYRLNDPEHDLEYFTEIGTPSEILAKILSGTGFTAGMVDFTVVETYSSQEKVSRRQLLMDFVNYVGGEVQFSKFDVAILTKRGSEVPKDLLAGRNVDVISKTVNKREKDAQGNPLISYECSLIRPMDIALGDVVTMGYAALDISVELRIVSITTNPYNKYEASFEIGNFIPGLADEARKIETSTLAKGKTYYGARISPENGFESITNDKMARGVFNAEKLALQVGDGTGNNWINKLHYDKAINELIFDGKLSANLISALEAEFDVTVSQTVIVNQLSAQKGNIAELTVDRLESSDKVQRYLAGDTSDMSFVRVQDQDVEFIIARTDGSTIEQLKDRNENLIYWTDDTKTGTTLNETSYPVMIYVYEEDVKMSMSFVGVGTDTVIPVIKMGTGVGIPGYPDRGKGFVFKDTNGLKLQYLNSEGEEVFIRLGEDGISFTQEPVVVQGDFGGQPIKHPNNLVWDDQRLVSGVAIPSTGITASTLIFELTDAEHGQYTLGFECTATTADTLTVDIASTSGHRKTITKTMEAGESEYIDITIPIPRMHPLDNQITATLTSASDALAYSNLEASLMGPMLVNQVDRTPDPYRPSFREYVGINVDLTPPTLAISYGMTDTLVSPQSAGTDYRSQIFNEDISGHAVNLIKPTLMISYEYIESITTEIQTP